jgi:sigma-B regulation protein RsbU (phosphoserine phosphatase)
LVRNNVYVFVLFLVLVCVANASEIDLTELDFYVRLGFNKDWLRIDPQEQGSDWLLVPGKKGNRPLIPRDLGIVHPAPPPIHFSKRKAEQFTFISKFSVDVSMANTDGLGLYLAQIGENWEIYLNGNLIKSEMFLDDNGQIITERAVRGMIVPIGSGNLNPGINTIVFRIVGDPSDFRTGLFMGAPYLIQHYNEIYRWSVEYLDITLIGIYIFFAMYHIYLFFLRKQNNAYLFYGISSMILSMYLILRTNLVFNIIFDTYFAKMLELGVLFILVAFFMFFFDYTIKSRISLFSKIYMGFCVFMVVLIPFVHLDSLLRIWQFTLIFPLFWLVVLDLIVPMISEFKLLLRKHSGNILHRLVKSLLMVIANTTIGKLSIGILVITGTIVFDVYAANAGISYATSKYGFLFLMFGSAGILASQFVNVYKQIEELNVGLEKKVEERTHELKEAMDFQTTLNDQLMSMNLKLKHINEISKKDMSMAITVQRGMFPKVAPLSDNWDIAYHFVPASGVSGDFFDFYQNGTTLEGLSLGDVSGHGIASGLVTVLAKSIMYRNFRYYSSNRLNSIVENANKELIHELAEVDNFLTCIVLRFAPDSVECVNAAHTEMIFKKAGGTHSRILVPSADKSYKGPPLGMEELEKSYDTMRFKINKDDFLVLYTDCLNESRNDKGEEFSVQGIIAAMDKAPTDTARTMLNTILSCFGNHIGNTKLTDDLTILVLKKK